MAADVCRKHQREDTDENPCLLCFINLIREHARSRDGSPETDEANLRTIEKMTEKILGIDFDSKTHEEKCDTVCDECGQSAPPTQSELHEDSCSLHPKNEVREKDYHVVLQRTYNVIIDHIKAFSETDAIAKAEKKCDTLDKHLSNIVVSQNVTLDDADDPKGAMVDTYGADGGYEKESYYEMNHRFEYVKKD